MSVLTPNDIFVRSIDYAALRPTLIEAVIRRKAEYAAKMNFASFCIHPIHVKVVSEVLAGCNVVPSTVIGFPLGNSQILTKQIEAHYAIKHGAKELDMVINLAAFADKSYNYVRDEIQSIVRIGKNFGVLIKVILETCYWDIGQLCLACQLVIDAGADFVKTSTGFAFKGADILKTQAMINSVDSIIGVKASGGIKTRTQAERYLKMGCTRLGIGSAIEDIMQ